jgi:DNA primase
MFEDLSYIDARDLLISIGCQNVTESGGEISFSCPSDAHQFGDRNPSARMNARTTAFICHNCGWKGNAITFLSKHKTLPETVARRLLEERYGGGGINAPVGGLEQMVKGIQNPVVIDEPERVPPDESWLNIFNINWEIGSTRTSPIFEYMIDERKFDRQILKEWEIGYDDQSKRITIPIRDHKGNLIGFKGRLWDSNDIGPKYMILGGDKYGFQPYHKSHYVFGMHKVCNLNTVVIVEGELNAIAMDQHGYEAIGIAGSEFSGIQCGLITPRFKEAILFLDNDKAGEKGTKKVVEMLSPYMHIKVVQNAPGDAADLDIDTVRELISNAESVLLLQSQGKL